ncbi:ent-kaurenoic acid oxidase 2 isoform X1 [Amborella trichopoda]|nr:ent-kaurenoic acid oxidase 2 isoform X1 [Amborella trichopoda]|eukprot:XP_006878489.2 ent-kaurenoic acid oxidase 2 isoform X1 [Amborella trichopoda]
MFFSTTKGESSDPTRNQNRMGLDLLPRERVLFCNLYFSDKNVPRLQWVRFCLVKVTVKGKQDRTGFQWKPWNLMMSPNMQHINKPPKQVRERIRMELGDFPLVTAIIAILIPLLLWLFSIINDWRYCRGLEKERDGHRVPPGSMGWPVIGELLDFLWCFKFTRRPDDFIAKRKSRHGDSGIFRTHLFGQPSIVTCSPEMNKFVLGRGTEDGSFGPGWPSSQLLGASSITMKDGLSHKRLKRYFMDAFNSPRALSSLLTNAQPTFVEFMENWVSKGRISAFEETRAVTFANICDILASFKEKTLLCTMERFYTGLMAGLRAMPLNFPGTSFHHALKCRKKLTDILLKEIKERKEKSIHKTDFMQVLLDSTDENGEYLSEQEIVDNTVSFILGGYESTSNVMTWALYYLAKYPTIMQKLKDETLSIRGKKPKNGLLSMEDLKAMKYTTKVADEVIRLANISPFIFRRVLKDGIVFNGYTFPKDWRILVWIRSNHIDSEYFDDPLTFNPNRWDNFKPKPGTHNVFGHGPRYCPGNNFAKLQVMMFLYYASSKYRWELINPNAGITFLPHPKPDDGVEIFFSHAL